jgi:adenylate kinase
MRIVILGGPGSGKKTQTGLLAEKYGLTVVAAGELVKQALAEESERGEQLRLQQQAGQSVTDDVVLTLLQERLQQPDLEKGFILDGFPRNLLQALTLDELLLELASPLDFVLLFEIETDVLMERLVGRRICRSCGAVYNIYSQPTAVDDVCDLCGGRLHQRVDDTEETVSSRLHVFDHLTGPLLSHYGKMGKVLRVDGEGEVESVFGRTCEAVDSYLAQRPDQAVAAEPPASSDTQRDEVGTVPAKTTPSGKGKPAKATTGSHAVPKEASGVKAASGKSSNKNSSTKRAAVKPAKPVAPTSTSKAVASKQQSSVNKKLAKKPVSKKKAVAKTASKKVVKKAAAKRTTAGKSPVSQRAPARKVVKKQVVKKSHAKPSASAKAKASVSKKSVAKKPAAKRAAKKKSVIKQAAPKASNKKKLTAKPSSAKKSVKKQVANKRAKGSSARR